ncbi:hypothetical protein BDW60DRAFT_27492 [Aspergillus nidulans var. acristatus]
MATDYAKKTNAELVEILKSRNLPHTGKKADMVARLQEDDSSKAAAPAQNENADDVIDWEDDEVPAATSTTTTKVAETNAAAAAVAPAPAEETAAAAAPKAEDTKTDGAKSQAGATQDSAKPSGTVVPTGAEEQAAQQPTEEKPAPNFALGLSVTDLEEELKKRKARAEKFGITEESQAAIDEAAKKLERAKRFGTAGEAPGVESVSRLDQALPERSRKRGRGENDQGGRGGKKRNYNGRNNNQRQRGRGHKGQGQGQAQKHGQAQKPATNNSASNGWSEKDKAAMEARKKRFGTGA